MNPNERGFVGCLLMCIKWLFAIAFFPITLLILIGKYFSNSEKRKEEEEREQDIRDFYILNNSSALNRHYEVMEKIKVEYPEALKEGDFFGPKMKRVIRLCVHDIKLAPDCKEMWMKHDRHLASLPDYPAFYRLAIIYEKQGKYDEAIDICKQAIDLGFASDGTKGGMVGRMERLITKSDRSKEKDL